MGEFARRSELWRATRLTMWSVIMIVGLYVKQMYHQHRKVAGWWFVICRCAAICMGFLFVVVLFMARTLVAATYKTDRISRWQYLKPVQMLQK